MKSRVLLLPGKLLGGGALIMFCGLGGTGDGPQS